MKGSVYRRAVTFTEQLVKIREWTRFQNTTSRSFLKIVLLEFKIIVMFDSLKGLQNFHAQV